MKTALCLLFVFINVAASATVKRHVKKKSAESILRDVKHHLDEAERLTKEVHDNESPQVVELADSIGDELARLGNWVNDVETPVQDENDDNEEALVSLEDSLEQAIAEDEQKSQSTKVNEKKELSNKDKLLNWVTKDVKNDSPKRYIEPYPADKMFGDEMEDSEVDVPDFDAILNEYDSPEKDHQKQDAQSNFKFGVHPDRPAKDDKKELGVHPDRPQHIIKMLKRKKDVAEMKKLVNGIKHDFGKIKENFLTMKNLYNQAVKDGKLEDIRAKGKLGEVSLDMKGILGSLRALKDMLPEEKEGNTKRGVKARGGFNKAKNLVGVIQDQIGGTAEAVNKMINLVSQPKEDTAKQNDDKDLVELDHLKDEMKDIITRLNRLLSQKDATKTKGVKKELTEMRKNFNEIKGKVLEIMKRHS